MSRTVERLSTVLLGLTLATACGGERKAHEQLEQPAKDDGGTESADTPDAAEPAVSEVDAQVATSTDAGPDTPPPPDSGLVMPEPAACDGVASGKPQTRERFAAARVAFGSSCQGETQTRTCNDGVWSNWSGTLTLETCGVCEQADSNCNGVLETKLTQVAATSKISRTTRPLFDSGLFLSVSKNLRVYSVADLTHPLHETVGFSPVHLLDAAFRAGTLVVQREDANELIVYELSHGALDPVERARIPTEGYPRTYLHSNGKILLFRGRNANDESVIKIVDLTVRSQPTELAAVKVDDCEGAERPSDSLLVFTGCGANDPSAFSRNRAYDISVPSAPTLVADWAPQSGETYLGDHAGSLYFQRGNVVSRRALVSGAVGGLGTSELLNVPQNSRMEIRFAFRGSSVFYWEAEKTGTAQRLCELTAASPTPRCFAGLVPADEVVAALYAIVDGDELVLIGQEYARHVDLTVRDAPVLGQRWVELMLGQAVRVDSKHIVASTKTGAAVLDPDTLSVQGFSPLDTDVNYCVASDGDQVFARTRDGEFNVLSMDDKGKLTLLSRERVLYGEFYECSIEHRGAQRYFVAVSSTEVQAVRLAPNGQVDGNNAHTVSASRFEPSAGLTISDNGQRLFVAGTDMQGRAVRELDLEGTGLTSPLNIPISKGPNYPILAIDDTLYLRDGSLQALTLSTGTKQAIPDTQNASDLCATEDSVFGLTQGEDPYLIEGANKKLISVESPLTQKSWYRCQASAQRMVLEDDKGLYLMRIGRE